MAVLVEGISVVVRWDVIEVRYPGGTDAFVQDAPNATLCMDSKLARVGFMDPRDVRTFIERLERAGIKHHIGGVHGDAVVIDQFHGPTSACDWIEFGSVNLDGNRVAIARLVGDEATALCTPDSWTFERSLTKNPGFTPSEEIPNRVKFLRRESGLDVYLDLSTGKEVYSGRTSK